MPGSDASSSTRATRRRGERRTWAANVRVLPIDGSDGRDDMATVLDRDRLERAFRRLSTEQSAIFVLHHYVGLTLAEVAEELGVPLGTVKSRLHYATQVAPGGARCRRSDGLIDGASRMTTDHDFDRIAMAWLADGPEALADRVMDAVVDEIHVTPQRHALRLPWRFPSMTTPARVAAAAVIGVLALGGALFALGPGRSGIGAPGATPLPTPTVLTSGPLAAGRYVTTPFDPSAPNTSCPDGPGNCPIGVCVDSRQPGCTENPADDTIRISFTLPAGWEGAPRNSVSTSPYDRAAPLLAGAPAQLPHDGAWLVFTRGASLYSDPCHATPPPDIAVGPTVDDFANALVAHPTLHVTAPVDVTLDGFTGKYMDLTVPDPMCPGRTDPLAEQEYWVWEPGFFGQGPGHRWHLWILDVNGIRVVIQAMDFAATSAQHQAELQAIVQSIQIQP